MQSAEELWNAVQHSGDPALGELACLKNLGDLVDEQRTSVEDDPRGDRVEDTRRDRQGDTRRSRSLRPAANQRRERVATPERWVPPRGDEIENTRTNDDRRSGDPTFEVAMVARPISPATDPV